MLFNKKQVSFRLKVLTALGWDGIDFESDWRDLLSKMYEVSGMSSTCIAKILGFSPELIRKDMKLLGVSTLGWSKFKGGGAHGFPEQSIFHRKCIHCGKEFSTIYSKEVTCKNKKCKIKFYERNKDLRKRGRYNEDFV